MATKNQTEFWMMFNLVKSSFRHFLRWISAFAMVLSFLPLLMLDDRWSSEDLEEFSETLRTSDLVFGGFAFTLGVCASVLVDCLAELLRTRTISFERLLRQLFLLASVAVPPFVYFDCRSSFLQSPYHSKLMMCILVCQRVAIVSPFLLQFAESPSGCFRGYKLLLLTLLCLAYPLFLPYWSTQTEEGLVFISITFAMMAAIFALLAQMTYCYVKYLLAKGTIPMEEFHTVIFYIPISFASIAVIYSFAKLEMIYNYSEDTLVTFSVCLSAMCVVAIQQPLRTEQSSQLTSMISSLDMKKFFVRYISHEIRTPLNVATVGLAMLSDVIQLLPSGEQKGSELLLNQVTEAVETAVDVLNDILTYDKITSNLMVLERTVTNPMALATETLKLFVLQAQKKGVTFLWNSQSYDLLEGRQVHADVHKLKQVVRNFASNALKFTPMGGSIIINFSLVERVAPVSKKNRSAIVPSTEMFRLELTDSGVGIASENLPRVFKEIVQFDANKLQEGKGSGMGLFISRTIIELHGGRIDVSSEGIDRGCTFGFEIPLLPRESGFLPTSMASTTQPTRKGQERYEHDSCRRTVHIEGSSVSPEPYEEKVDSGSPSTLVERWRSAKGSGTSFTHLAMDSPQCQEKEVLLNQHVLLVDDSPTGAKMMERFLKRLGMTCELAENGAVAVERITQNPGKFDFVFMDYYMPVMDGPTAVVAIRGLGYRCAIFGLTGNDSVEDEHCFLEAGADYVFTKPIKVHTFKATLIEQLASCKAARGY